MSRMVSLISTIRRSCKGPRRKSLLTGLLVWIAGAFVLWYSIPYQPRFILPGTEDSVVAGFSPDGKILATKNYKPRTRRGTDNGPIRLWDMDTAQELGSFSTNGRSAEHVEFSPNGSVLVIAAGRSERILSIIDIKTGQELANISADPGIKMTHLAADGNTLVFYPPGDEHAKLWDISLGRERLTLDCSPEWFSPDGLWLATMDSDSEIQIRNSASGEIIRTIAVAGKNRSFKAIAISPDSSMLVCDAYTGVNVWDPDTRRELAFLKQATNPKFSRNGRLLAARYPGVGGWTFKLWNASTGEESGGLDFPPAEWEWSGHILAGPGPEDFTVAATRTRGTISALSDLLPDWMTRFLGIRSSGNTISKHDLRVVDIASGNKLADYSTEEGDIHLAPDGGSFVVDSGSRMQSQKEPRVSIMVFDIPLRRPLTSIALWPLPFALAAMLIFRLFISRSPAKKVEFERT